MALYVHEISELMNERCIMDLVAQSVAPNFRIHSVDVSTVPTE